MVGGTNDVGFETGGWVVCGLGGWVGGGDTEADGGRVVPSGVGGLGTVTGGNVGRGANVDGGRVWMTGAGVVVGPGRSTIKLFSEGLRSWTSNTAKSRIKIIANTMQHKQQIMAPQANAFRFRSSSSSLIVFLVVEDFLLVAVSASSSAWLLYLYDAVYAAGAVAVDDCNRFLELEVATESPPEGTLIFLLALDVGRFFRLGEAGGCLLLLLATDLLETGGCLLLATDLLDAGVAFLGGCLDGGILFRVLACIQREDGRARRRIWVQQDDDDRKRMNIRVMK